MAVQPLQKLNERHHRFIFYYLEDFNATRAAKRAGFSEKSACATAYQLLQDPSVLAELKRQRSALLDQLHVDLLALYREHVKIAFSDISNLMSWDKDGLHLVKSEDLTSHETGAIQEFSIVEREFNGDGDHKMIISTKVKLYDKHKSLEALSRLLPRLNGTAGETDEAGKGLASLLEVAKQAAVTAREDI